MKKIISSILFVVFSSMAFADTSNCDWTKIVKNPDNTYTYSAALNLCVGQLVQDNKTKDAQLLDLGKALTLKDTALQDSDKRVQLWQTTSVKMEDSLQSYDSLRARNQWLFFFLGLATAGLAAYSAAKLTGR